MKIVVRTASILLLLLTLGSYQTIDTSPSSVLQLPQQIIDPYPLQVFPNPADKFIGFSINNLSTGACNVAIFERSCMSRQILSNSFNKTTTQHTETVNIQNLSEGMYWIFVTTPSGHYARSFLKRR